MSDGNNAPVLSKQDGKKDSNSRESSKVSAETNDLQALMNKRVTRRQALSTAAKAGIGIGVVVIVGGGAAYYFATQGGQQSSTTSSQSTTTPTSTSSVVTSSSSASSGATKLDFFIWQYGVQMVQDNVGRYNNAHPESNVVLASVPQE